MSQPAQHQQRSRTDARKGLARAAGSALSEEWLDRPISVDELAQRAKCGRSKVRRWLSQIGSRLQIGYTRPRRYWLPEQEEAKRRAEGYTDMKTISSRNRMG